MKYFFGGFNVITGVSILGVINDVWFINLVYKVIAANVKY